MCGIVLLEKNSSSWVYDVKAPGYKYNMPDLNAAVAVAQFEKAEDFRVLRQRIAERYREGLSGVSGIRLIEWRVSPDQHSHHLFPIVLTGESRISRNELIEALSERGIGTSVHYRPLHQMTYYRERYELEAGDFPNSEEYWRGCLSLPIYPGLSICDVDSIVSEVVNLVR